MQRKIGRILLVLLCSNCITLTIRAMSSQQNLPAVGANQDNASFYEVAQCLNRQFKLYAPPQEIQETLSHLFEPNFFETLEAQKDPIAWMKEQGLKPLQFQGDMPRMAVVVESDKIPGYIIKFMRITAPESWASKRRGTIKTAPKISNRVINAREIKKMITDMHLQSLNVPDKYFYCINDIALVIAKKVIASKRTLKDITAQELSEILKIVAASKGILDLRARNMILSDDAIYFIDTEKARHPHWWIDIQQKDLARFKALINPDYIPLVDAWAKKLDKRHKRALLDRHNN